MPHLVVLSPHLTETRSTSDRLSVWGSPREKDRKVEPHLVDVLTHSIYSKYWLTLTIDNSNLSMSTFWHLQFPFRRTANRFDLPVALTFCALNFRFRTCRSSSQHTDTPTFLFSFPSGSPFGFGFSCVRRHSLLLMWAFNPLRTTIHLSSAGQE